MLDEWKGPGGIFFAKVCGNRKMIYVYGVSKGLVSWYSKMVKKSGSALWSWLQILETRLRQVEGRFQISLCPNGLLFCDREGYWYRCG